jgi:hypothetical protein
VAAAVAGVIAVALLIDNIMLFKNNVAQYVAQGYPSSEVLKQLIPAQLLPGIFEPLVLYLGIALVLWGLGLINQKLSICQAETKDEISTNVAQETTSEENKIDSEIANTSDKTDAVDQVQEPSPQ